MIILHWQVQDQAKSAANKIEDLKNNSLRKNQKQNKEQLLVNASREYSTKMSLHEEKLEELSHRIRQMQRQDSLKEKVITYSVAGSLAVAGAWVVDCVVIY